ncbi:site-specific integrase [Domibacillus sp. PGB-M46]|uniref:tyrosine-type recombinase/integrase n=1 Tax=Domibacillus sp. PGB-M46 TaxID=2910255 RepID=UPI001F57F961|nr:site-specific integrase [Domibacillus sp. PGB-M46]MCI2255525.1 site-specific integrase [Domibacillus sp. PGB-M46]
MASIRKYKKSGDKKAYYEFRIRYKDPITHEYKEKSKRGFTSSIEAQIAAAEEEKRILEGFEVNEKVYTLESFLTNWLLEYKKGSVRKNTYLVHERNIKNHIIPYFQNLLLKDLKPIMYQKFLNHLTDKGYSKRTVEIAHGTMYNAMSKAIILGILQKNPCLGATVKGTEKRKEIQFIDSADIPAFLQAAYQDNYLYWLFFMMLIETGMRKGEAAALQWTDVDLKGKTISINRTLDFDPKEDEELFGDTKTHKSKRIITISQSLTNALQFHLKYQNQNKLALKDFYNHDLNLVLCRNDGNVMPKSTLFNSFARILKKAGLPQLSIHSLRHTHAVLLLESGADMKYIQERLGHGSMGITADVYSHISKKLEQGNLKRYEDYSEQLFKRE